MKIFLKTEDEIDLMRKANQLVGATLAELGRNIKPGVTTLQLDKIAEEFIRDHGAVPTFKDFPNPFGGPFPASICTSINDVVVHGIPSDKVVLKDGKYQRLTDINEGDERGKPYYLGMVDTDVIKSDITRIKNGN